MFSRFLGILSSRKDNLINSYFDILYKYYIVLEVNINKLYILIIIYNIIFLFLLKIV